MSVDAGLLGTGLTTPGSDDLNENFSPNYSAFRGEIRWNLGRDDGHHRVELSATSGCDLSMTRA